jgi:hypothetical protein
LLEAIKRLSNAETRRTLAEEALRIGELYFSHSRAESILFSALAAARPEKRDLNGSSIPWAGASETISKTPQISE